MPSLTPAKRTEFYDAQDDLRTIAAYDDIGVGPAVVFDGAGFTNSEALRTFAADVADYADWLERAAATRETELGQEANDA